MITAIYALCALLIFSCTGINDNTDNNTGNTLEHGGAALPTSVSYYENSRKPFLDLVNSIPDYYQRSGRFGGFPDEGSAYCGPAAASNALLWLYRSDYGKIIEKSGNALKDQYELIKILGSQKYFDTTKDGTNPSELCAGLKKFFDDLN
ncbi:MAG: hypothetical protein LBB56_08080, partial [Chitinispirillales bacterium]|nr:hypothetical protein [Chitinispirillales bacterium]